MKVAVIHPSLNFMGGAEYLALVMLQTFESQGYKTCLITLEKTNWNYVESLCGFRPKVGNEVIYPHVRLPMAYEPVYWKWIERAFYRALGHLRGNFDIAINTHPEVLYIDADIFFIHDPHMSMLGLKREESSKNPIWWIYRKSRRYLLDKLRRDFQRRTILTNSNYCREFLNKYWGINATVIFPPVNVDLYHSNCFHAEHSKPWVVTVSRFARHKRLEIIPEVAVRVPKAKFLIIGCGGGAHLIKAKSKRLGVENRIVLMPNVSLIEKLKVMSKAQVYLHTTLNEGFGIAIVEAMAAGLAPVVHKSGGPWTDILQRKQGVFGYGFETTEEAVQHISELLDENSLRLKMIDAAGERARTFSENRFKSDILETTKRLMEARIS